MERRQQIGDEGTENYLCNSNLMLRAEQSQTHVLQLVRQAPSRKYIAHSCIAPLHIINYKIKVQCIRHSKTYSHLEILHPTGILAGGLNTTA